MRSIVMVLAILFLSFSLHATAITYNDSWGDAGLKLDRQNAAGVEVNFSIQEFNLDNRQINGETMQGIQLPGVFLPNDEGAPDLPGTGRYIAIPQGATPTVRIIASRTEKFSNIDLAPAPRIPLTTENGPLDYHKNNAIYSQDAFYPAEPVKISQISKIRGVDAVILGITPFQYNPVTKELIVYRDLRVEVSFDGGNGHFGEDRLRSRWWDPLLEDMLLNYESLPKMDYNRSFQGPAEDTGCEYLIICPTNPEFRQWADSLKVFRTLQGIKTQVVTLDVIGGNNPTTIENYINDAYNTWQIPPAAILLFGDYGTDPTNSVIAPIYNSYCASDNIYADVDADQMPDIIAARMTARNATELQTMVTKAIHYEKNPPTDPNFYAHPMTCLGYQTERWFQICTESVAGFWEQAHGKTVNRINAVYNGSPQTGPWSTATNTSTVTDYFGPNGLGYIPASPGQISCSWTGTGNNVVTGINNGAFMLLHRDHGAETLWGEPDFSNSHVSQLTNTDLCFVWSVNCLTGKYNYSGECMVEKLHRHTYNGENSGALGVIGDAEVSYSFVNDTYVWGAFDNMWPDFMPGYGTTPASRDVMPGFANAAGKYFLQQSSWPYNTSNKEVTYNLFHDHADAFLTVYSEIPQPLTVNHPGVLLSGQNTFSITADQDAFIALTVDGEIIGTGTGTGATTQISIPPQLPGSFVEITVTKQNYYRYSASVPVTAASGPYLFCISPITLDNTCNGNGIPESGETVELKLNLTNLGVQEANNITGTISSADTCLNILNGTTSIAYIDTSDTVLAGSFSVEISPNTPHMHKCSIDLQLQADSAGVPNGYTFNQIIQIEVREGAKINLAQNHLSFSNTFLTFTSTLPLTIENNGPDTLRITDIVSDIPQFTPEVTALDVAPGAQEVLNVGFTPDSTMTYNGTLTIFNTDPVNYEQTFTTDGIGIFAPDISCAQDTIIQEMTPSDSQTVQISLENLGLGDLIFNAQIAGFDPTTQFKGAGGSDTYGHMWIDSDEPNGPTFDWIDITTTGTELALTGNNSITQPVNIGFTFNFYGEDYTAVRVCTNGWLSFTTFSVAYNNFALPSNLAPRALLAPLWDDLNFQQDSKAYFENQGNKVVVLYQNIYRVTGEGPYTFEVVLYDNGNIVYQYLDLQNLLDDYTVGIQNHVADDGLTIAYNEPYLHNALAVLISKHSWVSVSPMSGTISAQSSQDLTLTFITNQFPVGDFWASLQVESNDPDEEVFIVPIHMTVKMVGVENADLVAPKEFKLYQNSPNPFNPTTNIFYSLAKSSDVELTIYNLLGQKVKTLVNSRQQAKQYKVVWDGTNNQGVKVASGIYVYRLKAGDKVAVRKMILMK